MPESIRLKGSYDNKEHNSLNEPLNIMDHWYSDAALNVVGTAGGANQTILSKEVEVGHTLVIFNIHTSLYESASLAGRIIFLQSSTAATGGTDIELMDVLLETVTEAGPLGVAAQKTISAPNGSPLIVINNQEGAASVFLNAEIAKFVGGSLVGDAVTKNYGVSWSGVYL